MLQKINVLNFIINRIYQHHSHDDSIHQRFVKIKVKIISIVLVL